jgi:hypothetical protein
MIPSSIDGSSGDSVKDISRPGYFVHHEAHEGHEGFRYGRVSNPPLQELRVFWELRDENTFTVLALTITAACSKYV